MEYTSLEKLKSYLSIEDDSQDDEIEDIISQGTALLDIELGDNIGEKEYTRRIDGSGSCKIIMENAINSVTSIQYIRNGIYADLQVDFIEGHVIHLLSPAPKGDSNIKIIYTKGYSEVPKDLELYFLEYCREIYKTNFANDNEVVKTKKLGELSLTYFSPSEIESGKLVNMARVIDKYKNFNIHVCS